MLSIFNRKPVHQDLRWVQVDMHSHLLPGIDDGCAAVEESVALIERLALLGLQYFHFTPHVFQEMYPNTRETIAASYQKLKGKGVDSLLSGYAAEYMMDASFEQTFAQNKNALLVLPGGYVLVEMSYMQENTQIERMLFDLQIEGYIPVLAHPERYVYYHNDPKKIQRFQDVGCLLQLNLLSVLGYYGAREKKVATYLLEKGMVNLVGTDVHHERHVKALEAGVQREDLRKLFKHCLIQNEELFANTTGK
ncbi:MAG TPA: CpsB/CapC family capsule biosynthesis tyrosine phosphatase [Sphingobacterium sp.]|nr:CpsB/CapC family capsule biosynthesis tyrosine phosphatase [Sphingobacterium sp.]